MIRCIFSKRVQLMCSAAFLVLRLWSDLRPLRTMMQPSFSVQLIRRVRCRTHRAGRVAYADKKDNFTSCSDDCRALAVETSHRTDMMINRSSSQPTSGRSRHSPGVKPVMSMRHTYASHMHICRRGNPHPQLTDPRWNDSTKRKGSPASGYEGGVPPNSLPNTNRSNSTACAGS
jgi:hypothetical protein